MDGFSARRTSNRVRHFDRPDMAQGLPTSLPVGVLQTARLSNRVADRAAGLTLLEVLLVVAILAVVLGIGVFNGRQAVTAQGELAAINSLQQTVWQGATAASARGQVVTMRMEGHDLVLRVGDDGEGQVLRRESFPADVITNMPQGNVLLFTPPGKVEINSLAEAQDFYLGTSKGQSFFEISVIGEVRVR